jgi:hypothetical protein
VIASAGNRTDRSEDTTVWASSCGNDTTVWVRSVRVEVDQFAAALARERLRQEARQDSMRFRRPPRRCGRGRPPLRRWEERRR